MVDGKKHDIKIVQTDVFADNDDAGNSLGYKNNRLVMDKVALDNIRQIPDRRTISHQDEELCRSSVPASSTWEMVFGTGKTYVYIKTMSELNKQYGWDQVYRGGSKPSPSEKVKKSFDVR